MRIALIPGDGIGREVVPAAISVLTRAAQRAGVSLSWEAFPWGCDYYQAHGTMMPPDGLKILERFDAIMLGAVGDPRVPDHVSLWGLLIPIRRGFRQYVNVRPVQLMPGVRTPLEGRSVGDIDFCIVRENTEGEYSDIGGRANAREDSEVAIQVNVFSRRGVDRVVRYAFELAQSRRSHVASATKSNGITYTMPFWDERFDAIASRYPHVGSTKYHIDILAAQLVQHPEWFDVIVGSNLFGDILSDLGAAIAGGMGLAPSANINPEREWPSMFEPVHGSAPDIAGQGVANPIAQILAGAMMLDHLDLPGPAASVRTAVQAVLARGSVRTPDLGGHSTTDDVAGAVIAELRD